MKRIVKKEQTPQAQIDKFWSHKFNITSFLFDKQLAFVEDPSPFKVAVCSRRAGKTVACAAHLIHSAINNKDSTNLYITLSSTSGKRIIWKEFKKIVKQFNLPCRYSDAELSITFPNGGIIYVIGAHDATEIEKFRGLPIKLCYIDECQSFKAYIKDLIDDIIGPALIDYAGSLCLIGTPSAIPTGYFHDCAVKNPAWSKHHWTFWDNPHIPVTSGMTHQQVFDREMTRRGASTKDPSVQREWWGKWESDTDSLIIKYNEKVNNFSGLTPNIVYNYILGIDVGFDDADALAVLAWSEHDPVTYLIEEVITAKQGLTPLVAQIRELEKKYPISKMTMDFGGLGKKLGEEMIRQYQVPVEAAEKSRKMENIELLNDALRRGHFKAKGTSQFAQDSYLIEKDRNKSRPDKIVISDRFHSDIADAVLYAFKFSPAFAYEPPKPKPKPGTKEYADQLSNDMFNAALEHFQDRLSLDKRMRGEFD